MSNLTTPTTNALNVSYLDFDTIKASLRDYLRSQSQLKDYNFEGSALTILLDILAYNTHYNAFYMNMIANEMFLDSANLRSSVVSLAKHLNYTPRSITSAQANVSVVITPNDDAASAVIQKNTKFSANVNGTAYTFVTPVAYGATITNGVFSFPDVTLVEGIPYIYRITVDSTVPNQRFLLPNSRIDTSQLSVQVQTSLSNSSTTNFVLADNLLQIQANSNVFWLQEAENMQFEMKFGDGVIGTALIDGNIILASYVISDGPAANGASSFTPSIPLAGYPATNTMVTTLVSSAGGLDAETTDEIRFTAPKNYEAQGRAVTAADYSLAITDDYTNADSVTVWGGEDNVPPMYGKVFISIKPVAGFVITAAAKQLVLENIIASKNIVSVIPEFIDPDYTFVIVNCMVKYNPSNTTLTSGDINSAAYKAILNYATLNLDKFDLEFRYSKLLSAIDNCDASITNNLTTIQIKKIFSPSLLVVANYTLLFYNPVTPGTLTSSSFVTVFDPLLLIPYVDGYTYTFADDALGNVQMIRHGIGVPDAVARKCGTINYSTGEVVLQEIMPYQGDANGNISITMNPKQNDIIPVRNNILFIQDSDVFVSVLPNG